MKKLILISLIASGLVFPGEVKAKKKDTACLVIITKPGTIKPKPKKKGNKKIVEKRKVKKI